MRCRFRFASLAMGLFTPVLWLFSLQVHAEAAPTKAVGGVQGMALEKVVMLLRHGVRSPNQTAEQLSESSFRPWPDWGIEPGDLTVHGAKLIGYLGRYYRMHYADLGLLSPTGCPTEDAVSVWADNSTRRIPFSAQVLVENVFPGCDLRTGFMPQTAPDKLFHPVELGTCPLAVGRAEDALLAAVDGDINQPMRELQAPLQFMQSLLKVRPRGVCIGNVSACGIDQFANAIRAEPEGIRLEGGLMAAATVGENILLEYVEGFPADQVGWGQAASPEALGKLLAPRNRYLDITKRTPYLAAQHGTPLMRVLLGALDDQSGQTPQVTVPPPGDDFVAIVGRDLHLAVIGALLGLNWTLPDQPDRHGSGVTIALERWRHAVNDQVYVRPVIHYQTLSQMRGAKELDRENPPGRVVLTFPGCEDDAVSGACPLSVVREQVNARLAPECPKVD